VSGRIRYAYWIEFVGMSSRLRVYADSSASPSRRILNETCVPLGPRSLARASSIDIPIVSCPSISAMTSPARIPARKAGVPSIGEMTVSAFSSPRSEITIPSPENEPRCSSRISL